MFFRKHNSENLENTDVLEAYPERMQISAIPERRYLKTARFLAVFTFLNIGILIALAGIFVYYCARLDVSVSNRKVVNLYAMDREHKVIKASEYDQKSVPALQLQMEDVLRKYILARHTIIWDQEKQSRIWGPQGIMALYSSADIYKGFVSEGTHFLNRSRQNKTVQDAHLYDLIQTPSGMWTGVLEIFDMPIPDMFDPLCKCQENTLDCLTCKRAQSSSVKRYKIFVRANFSGKKMLLNPLGIMVVQYYALPFPKKIENKNWDLPPILRK